MSKVVSVDFDRVSIDIDRCRYRNLISNGGCESANATKELQGPDRSRLWFFAHRLSFRAQETGSVTGPDRKTRLQDQVSRADIEPGQSIVVFDR
jgi:hypothetical protein